MFEEGAPRPAHDGRGAPTIDANRRVLFARQVRDALAHLFDPVSLRIHPLARLIPRSADPRGLAVGMDLRQLLLDAIESLHPITGVATTAPPGTSYQILLLRYVEGLDVAAIQARLALGKSEYYRAQQRGLDAVVALLWDHWRGHGAVMDDQVGVATLPRNNLPISTTSFVGRQRELAAVTSLLQAHRLVTLTGPAGVGKTRLALKAAAEMLAALEDGAWLIDLAPLADAALVPQAMASAVGVQEEPGRPLAATLADALRHRRLLLVLDNCEHLLDACARLVDALLRACPKATILATCREPLDIAGETLYRLAPLQLPDEGQEPSPEALNQVEAVRLFVERALAGQLGFAVTEQNGVAVAQVCRQLDGIPLALELAAARVRVLSVEEIAARLDDRFRLLTGGSRTASPRHQTLRAAISWSYALLTPMERTLFDRLAVFVGGWTLESVEMVCAGDDIEAAEVLDLLTALVDRSLALAEPADASQTRYRLLESLRQYAHEQLVSRGGAGEVQRRHTVYYVALAERAEPHLTGPQQLAWLDRLQAEHDNLRAALRHSVEADDWELAFRLGAALWRFWYIRGHLAEGRRWLELLLTDEGGGTTVPPSLRARVLVGAGFLAYYQGDSGRAAAACGESLALARATGDRAGIAAALHGLALVARGGGDYTAARILYGESRIILLDLGDVWGVAYNQTYAGVTETGAGEPAAARRLIEKGLAGFRAAGDRLGVARALCILGEVVWSQGDAAAARVRLVESLALMRALGDRLGGTRVLYTLAAVTADQGDHAEAGRLYAAGATELLDLGDREVLAICLDGLAGVATAQAQFWRAARLFGAASALRDDGGWRVSAAHHAVRERYLAAARSGVGSAAFAAAWGEGRALSLEQALAADDAASAASEPTTRCGDAPGQGRSIPGAAAILSPREREVLRRVAEGLTDARVAERLCISPHTVRAHLRAIFGKLDVASRAAATRYAVEHDLV